MKTFIARGQAPHRTVDARRHPVAIDVRHADRRHEQGQPPSFSHAARPELAEPVYEHFCAALRAEGIAVATGTFGVRMLVELVNDGPVTIILEA